MTTMTMGSCERECAPAIDRDDVFKWEHVWILSGDGWNFRND